MIEAGEGVAGQGGDDAGLLLYDYFKHLTTLALVALGGVLGIAQGDGDAKRGSLIVVVILLGMGGAAAFAGADSIIKARVTGRPAQSLNLYRLLSAGGLGMGVGAFLAFFLKDFG